MSIGPVEYVILGFPGNKFPDGKSAGDLGLDGTEVFDFTGIEALNDGKTPKTVHVKATKDGGKAVEFDAVEELAAFAGLDAEVGGILTDEDVAHAALSLEPNTSAVLIIWEDRWAGPFAEAVRNASGVILEGARIPREIIEQAMGALADALG